MDRTSVAKDIGGFDYWRVALVLTTSGAIQESVRMRYQMAWLAIMLNSALDLEDKKRSDIRDEDDLLDSLQNDDSDAVSRQLRAFLKSSHMCNPPGMRPNESLLACDIALGMAVIGISQSTTGSSSSSGSSVS